MHESFPQIKNGLPTWVTGHSQVIPVYELFPGSPLVDVCHLSTGCTKMQYSCKPHANTTNQVFIISGFPS